MYQQPISQKAHERQDRDRAKHGGHDHADPSVVPPLDSAVVRTLAARAPALTTSIFLPTHRAGSDRHQDHSRMKNLIHQARPLLGSNIDEERVKEQLAPLMTLIEDPGFWTHPQDGLALFISDHDIVHLKLPATVREQIVVCEHCHIKPLLPWLQGDGRFYVLELTQHGVQLFAGSRLGLNPVALPGAPASIEQDKGAADHEHHTEARTVQGSAQHSSMYFGSVGDVRAKDDISHYFRRIDASVCALLHAERVPLVTVGVEYLLPLYREVNSYPNLVPHGIPVNPAPLSAATLHERAWNVVAPQFQAAVAGARERYAQLQGTERASADLTSVLRAVVQGRVGDLFVASDIERWGTYDEINDKVREHDPRWPTDDDLLNLALIRGFATHSFTQVVPRSEVPGGGDVAATFRY